MVRKQLNIGIEQDEALKRLAAVRGVSESEVVREAIDLLVRDVDDGYAAGERAAAILDELFAEWDGMEHGPIPKGLYRSGVYDAR